ncbi:hypothetical protein JL475_30015 [Streptomyces sp. M2CJ-2]|uniref:hypothetical protein n=1 Tax=Streptomyces sp. M2CJ-2 TaxID=2803948 RepID=UPI0019294DBA|nr:hypothetical protein [Streptomyces sp. M2CJ-2]MBL3670141.1 hypothetical protein [Streptomyces sp. M2CJ-2]
MTQTMQPTTETTTPRAFGWCHWHEENVEGVRLITVIEQGSGSGITHFACPPCMAAHRLVPFANRP